MEQRHYIKEIVALRDASVNTKRRILAVSRCLANVQSRS